MAGVLLALLVAAGWGTSDFLAGSQTKRHSVVTVSLVSQAVGLAFAATVVLLFAGGSPMDGVVVYGTLGGVIGLLGLLALYSGLAAGPMGLVAPIAAMEVVVPVVFGVFARGERPDPLQFLGVALAVAGILLVTRGHDGQEAPVTSRAILLGVLAALLLGTMVVFMDAGGRISAAWTVLFLRVGAMGVLVPAALIVRPSFRLESRDKSTLVAVGLLDNGSNLLFTLAAATGALLSLIGVLASLYPVTTVFLARLVLSERLTRIQITGVVAAFAGVALIAAG